MKILDNPVLLLVLLAIVLILFGANRLPGVAKSLGQSLKIFKSEVKDLRGDEVTPSSAAQPTAGQQTPPAVPPETPTADGGRAPNA